MKARGFTLIELLVVMAIIATLLTLVTPRYFAQVDRAREAALRETLAVTRQAIDRFHGDHDRYPSSLEELVEKRYLRGLPTDPVNERSDTWQILPPPGRADGEAVAGGVWDLRSGAEVEGKAYGEW